MLGTLLVTTAFTVPAYAIEVVVVTAEKRAEDVQTVPVAISVFGSEKRDAIGISSVQDMTNFTPGLAYQTSLDRVFLRGVGRQTNSQAADTAPVANYDDGLYETFAVAAGRSSMDLERVEVLRGPQGTLFGRNALGGAINEVTVRPSTDAFHGEARLTYGAYNEIKPEISLTGPIDDVWAFRVYGLWDYQTQGYSKNIYPHAQQGTNDPLYTGHPTFNTPNFGNEGDGNVINEWYVDAQLQAKFSPQLEMWTKIQSGAMVERRRRPWRRSRRLDAGRLSDLRGRPELAQRALPESRLRLYRGSRQSLRHGEHHDHAGKRAVESVWGGSVHQSRRQNPWTQAGSSQTQVRLPSYFSLNSQWTWHTGGFDVKYISSGSYYSYHLSSQTNVAAAPIAASYTVGNYTINNNWTYNPEEENSFISNEIQPHFHDRQRSAVGGWRLPVLAAGQSAGRCLQSGPAPGERSVRRGWPRLAGLGRLFGADCAGGNGVGARGGVCAPSTTFTSTTAATTSTIIPMPRSARSTGRSGRS